MPGTRVFTAQFQSGVAMKGQVLGEEPHVQSSSSKLPRQPIPPWGMLRNVKFGPTDKCTEKLWQAEDIGAGSE